MCSADLDATRGRPHAVARRTQLVSWTEDILFTRLDIHDAHWKSSRKTLARAFSAEEIRRAHHDREGPTSLQPLKRGSSFVQLSCGAACRQLVCFVRPNMWSVFACMAWQMRSIVLPQVAHGVHACMLWTWLLCPAAATSRACSIHAL